MLDESRSHHQKKDSNNQIGGVDYVYLGQVRIDWMVGEMLVAIVERGVLGRCLVWSR